MDSSNTNSKSFSPGDIFWGVLAILFTACFAGFGAWIAVKDHHYSVMQRQANRYVIEEKAQIETTLSLIKRDIRYLVNSVPLADFFTKTALDNHYLDLAEQELKRFCEYQKFYRQIRILDLEGKESIRINYSDGNCFITRQDALQDKSERYYFKEGIKLNPGEIYISHFDLNVENGTLTYPLVPLIRFVTPLVDQNNNKKALLILNYDGQELLSALGKIEGGTSCKTLLLDNEGYYLKGLSSEDEWGFMIPARENKRISRLSQTAKEAIYSSLQGKILDPAGIFCFETLNAYDSFLDEKSDPTAGTATPLEHASWKIVAYVPDSILSLQLAELMYSTVAAVAGVTLLVLGLYFAWVLRVNRRCRREQKLIRDHKKFQTIFDITPVGMLLVDENSVVLQANRLVKDLLGKRIDEIVQQMPGQVLNCPHYSENQGCGYAKQCLDCPFHAVRNGSETQKKIGKNETVPLSYFHKEQNADSPGWVSISSEPITLDGKPHAIVAIHDVTDRKVAQDEATRLAAIVESSDDPIIGLNLDGIITSWNQGAEKLYGYTAAEAVGQYSTLIIPDDRQLEESNLLVSIQTGKQIRLFETMRKAKNGQELEVSLTMSPIKNSAGNIIGASTIARDITSRRVVANQLEQERTLLAAEKELLRVILSSIGVGLVAANYHKNIILMNKTAEEMTGYEPEEVRELEFDEIIRIVDERTMIPETAMFTEVLETGNAKFIQDNLVLLSKYHTKIPVEVSISPLHDEQNHNNGFVMVMRDVTQKREVDQMKKDFVSSVSHELRTPLTSIKAFSAMMVQNPNVVEELRTECMTNISEESDRLATLIEDLLEISRIESGTYTGNMKEIAMDDIFEHVIRSLSPLAEKKDVILFFDYQKEMRLHGDASKIESLLVNLINNAIKFTPGDGKVTVRSWPVENELMIEIEDTGMGIPKKDLDKIFDRFHRVQRKGVEIQGTGLGLAIVREIVNMHHGRIEVESEEGEGTTFRVYLSMEILTDVIESQQKETRLLQENNILAEEEINSES